MISVGPDKISCYSAGDTDIPTLTYVQQTFLPAESL